jgi:Txe/YoeB family toxin of Txe-Axe toxin-antitoxin module
VAIRAKYFLQVHPLVLSEDLPILPVILRVDFEELFKPILQSSPDTGGILSFHKLKGDLRGYHALEIPFDDAEYRLVYRIFDKPAPKRVRVISFDIHDPAYEKAKERVTG